MDNRQKDLCGYRLSTIIMALLNLIIQFIWLTDFLI